MSFDLYPSDDTKSILDCFNSQGYIDTSRYLQMCCDKLSDDDFDKTSAELLNDQKYPDPQDENPKLPQKRRKRFILARRKKDGELEAIPPTESMWYLLYVSCPFLNDPGFLKKFRRRFRIPYDSYIAFVEEARAKEWFPRWSRPDAMGKACSPLELLILGAFRYLGRGFTFDDLEEATAISEEVHHCFFHKFIEVGSTILYNRYVNTPANIEMVKEHMVEFELAGMPGAFGSTDATHIVHERCSWRI